MLNEVEEFKEYSENLKDTDKPRLIASLFFETAQDKKTVKCSGITRALTILARHYLFSEGKDYYKLKNAEERKEKREEVLKKLSKWCFEEEGVLYKYFEKNEGNEKKLWDRFIGSKKNSWETTDIYKNLNAPAYYEFAINFSIVIAEAIQEGPLKVRYLKIKKGFEQKIYFETKTMRKENTGVKCLAKDSGEVKGKCADYRDQLLKQICACLVSAKNSSEYIYINSIDLANWLGKKSFASNSDIEQVVFFYGEKKDRVKLYEYKNKKCRIKENIIKDLEISLIDEEECEKLKEQLNSDYVIYKDNGSGIKSLEQI